MSRSIRTAREHSAYGHDSRVLTHISLNQQIGDERELFGVIWGEEGWEPPVPHRPRKWSRVKLEKVVVGVVAKWIDGLIPSAATGLAWEVTTPDGTVDAVPVGDRGHLPR